MEASYEELWNHKGVRRINPGSRLRNMLRGFFKAVILPQSSLKALYTHTLNPSYLKLLRIVRFVLFLTPLPSGLNAVENEENLFPRSFHGVRKKKVVREDNNFG